MIIFYFLLLLISHSSPFHPPLHSKKNDFNLNNPHPFFAYLSDIFFCNFPLRTDPGMNIDSENNNFPL